MDKREVEFNGYKITYSVGMNQFLVVPFVDKAVKCMQSGGVTAKVVGVDVYHHVKFGSRMVCDITVSDGQRKAKHQYVDLSGDVQKRGVKFES